MDERSTIPSSPFPLEGFPQGVLVADADGRFVEANPEACKILGCPREELLASGLLRPPWKAVASTGAPLPPEAFPGAGLLRGGSSVRRRTVGLLGLDGAVQWLQVSAGAFPAGGVVITLEPRPEQPEPGLEEAFFRDLLERQGEGFGMVDLEERFIYANPVAEEIFGAEPGTLAGRSLAEFLDPDQTDLVRSQTRRRLAGESDTYELGIRRPSGERRILLVTVTPRPAQDGRAFAVIGVFRDITDVKRAEAALRASEEKFSKAFHASPDSININRLDDGTYLAVNDGFTRITGYAREEVIGRSSLPGELGLWVREKDRRRLVEGLRREGMVQGLEAAFRRKDGTELIGLMSASLIEVEGEPCVLSITRDITERKKAEEERTKLHSQLMQAQKMESLGSLAGGVAHDMNNVLGAILGLASANLEVQPPGSAVHHAFDTIAQAATRGGKMVKSLLAFARHHPSEVRDLDVNALVREQIQLLEHTTLAKVVLQIDLMPGLRPIRGDANALAHAFMNLCVNAVDAMEERGTLTLRTREVDGDWIEVRVEDDGCGMPKEIQARAMDPFFTTKPVGQGTGLGLSMVYSTMQAHQGQLEILSEPGRGTTVTLRFPAAAGGAAEGAEAQEPEGPTEPLTVLLVDDDELIQKSLKVLLETLGHDVIGALSGEDALRKLRAGAQPDVILLDLNMPGLGGAGTLPLIRALRPGIPVLLATGRADQTAMDLVAGNPGVALMAKPFSLLDLKRRLSALQAPRG